MLKNKHIFIIDDEPMMTDEMKEIFEREGYTVDVAQNGNDILGQFEETPPDLVIVDIRMPKIDGITLIEKLQEINPDVPIIIVTGSTAFPGETSEEDLKAKVHAFLRKPFDVFELLSITKELL